MGGLVARYYIENCTVLTHYETGKHNTTCKYGDLHVSKLITIDTPHWGSGYADVSCNTGEIAELGVHKLCDHDLRIKSKMYGGSFSTALNCKAMLGLNPCYTDDYILTDELLYNRLRSTRYYAIAGIDYNATVVNNNNQAVEILEDFATYEQLDLYIKNATQNQLYKAPLDSSAGEIVYMNLSEVDDNVVEFYSQIGWYGDTSNASPAKKVNMYKICVFIDSDGGNTLTANNHLHGKIPHREEVMLKVGQYLWE